MADDLEVDLKGEQNAFGLLAVATEATASDHFVAKMFLELDEFISGHENSCVLPLFYKD
jgi:hypothetical protein